MAERGLPDLDVARVRRWCEQRVPEHVRYQIRVECDVGSRHLTIVECRPPWHEGMGPEWTRFPVARLRYSKATGRWSLYWRDRNLRLYAGELVRRGAQVVGFDHSPRMVEICRARVGQGDFRVHDLADPIDWLPDGCVDLVLCALAIEYVDDRVAALRELRRVLRPGGALVLSRQHPAGDWLRHGGSYFDVRVIHETWSKGWPVRYWLAPLEVTCEEIFAAGFLIERLLEPRPVPGAVTIDRQEYERLTREPRGFIAFRLRPRT